MSKLYNYIIFNFNDLTEGKLSVLLYELKLQSLAVFLKNKFSDKRSVGQLVNLIKTEYNV